MVVSGAITDHCLVFRVLPERPGVNGGEVPPVPIPNTEVKLTSADNTWLETAREDRAMPGQTVEGLIYLDLQLIFLLSSVGRACGC